MIRTLLELLSNFIKIHYPVYGFGLLRLLLVLFGSVLLLAFFEWRFKTLTRFRNEKSTALNLAVARVAVAATLLCQVHLQEILLNASIDPALSIPFRVWGRLFAHLQGSSRRHHGNLLDFSSERAVDADRPFWPKSRRPSRLSAPPTCFPSSS